MTALSEYQRLEAEGRYFDGQTATPQEVIVKFGDASLMVLDYNDMPITHWPLASLRALGAAGRSLTLIPNQDSDERLTIEDKMMIHAIERVCPDLMRGPPVKKKRLFKVIGWSAAAIASVYMMVFHIIPGLADQMAELISPEAEIALGEGIVDDVARLIASGEVKFCSARSGAAALAHMTEVLERAVPLHVPLNVRVLEHEMVNAFALPGGQIVLMEGLLKSAKSPEEVAAVLAHEIGHVAARDPTRMVLRSAGSAGVIGLLLGDFAGATVAVAVSEAILQSSYRREAEAAADDYAIALMRSQNLPLRPMGRFFRSIAEEYGDVKGIRSHLATHPNLIGRAEKVEAADQIGDAAFTPILTDQEWVALRGICG